MSAGTAHDLLEELLAEQSVHPSPELQDEIEAVRAEWVGLAVTEIATLRAELSGPLEG